jgi:hypothetical protein
MRGTRRNRPKSLENGFLWSGDKPPKSEASNMSGEAEKAPPTAASERAKEAAGLNNVTNVVTEREMDQARIESVRAVANFT